MNRPELSIIIPILNERQQLPELFADLARQQSVDFELLISDGGSADDSCTWVLEQFERGPLTGRVVSGSPGRGRQLNRGALEATGDWLLFLHADSRFADPMALRLALDHLQQTGSKSVAGHFLLSFRRCSLEPSAGYYFYAWKARLGRPGTIHGDQGFLLQQQFFARVGPFREDLPVMEDTDFAERVRRIGNWLLLPGDISTSARRFEEEGLWQRQLLNAVLMCLRSIGYDDFFRAAPEVYRHLQTGDKLNLHPFFSLVRKLFAEQGRDERWRLWWRCGCYVRSHAWQLTFALDAARAFRQGLPVGRGRLRLTEWCEPLYELLTDNPAGRLAATLLLRLWFELTDLWLQRLERNHTIA